MTDYEYYLQNKENISTVNIKQLKVDKELNQWDYQYVYDINDDRNSAIIKCSWVAAIMYVLIAFIILSYNEVETNIMIFVLILIALVIINCAYIITFILNIDKIKIYKENGILVKVKGEKAYIYHREQNIVVKLYYYNSGWHYLHNIKLGSNMTIYKIRNRYICIKGDYKDEGSEDNKDNI